MQIVEISNSKNDLLKEELRMFFNNLDEDLKIGQEVFNNSLKIIDGFKNSKCD